MKKTSIGIGIGICFTVFCFLGMGQPVKAAEFCQIEVGLTENGQQKTELLQGLSGDIPFLSLRDFSALSGKYVHWFGDSGAIGWTEGQRAVFVHPRSNFVYLVDCSPVLAEEPAEEPIEEPMEESVGEGQPASEIENGVAGGTEQPEELPAEHLVGIPVPEDAVDYVEQELKEQPETGEGEIGEALTEQPKPEALKPPVVLGWNYTVKKEKLPTPITIAKDQTYIHMTLLPYLGYEGVWSEPEARYNIERIPNGELAGLPLEGAYGQIKETLQKELPPIEKILGKYKTSFNPNEKNRTVNLKLAAAAIHGKVIQPGKSFSFNGVVGPRTKERGYLPATIFVGGKKEQGLGGGICQVSSTLYNAVLNSKLTVVERHTHSLPVTYVPTGKDATVSYGWLDFRFKNQYAKPVKIQAVAGKNTLEISFVLLEG